MAPLSHMHDGLSPVDLERQRLQGIIAAAFEGTHYNPMCGCEHCSSTREFLSPEDVDFINKIAVVVTGDEVASLIPRSEDD